MTVSQFVMMSDIKLFSCLFSKLFLALVVFGLSVTTQAAPITWGAATNTTGKSQLIEGNVVFAVSGGSNVTIINGGSSGASTYHFTGVNYTNLTFNPTPGARITSDVSNGAVSTGDTSFDTVIRSITDTSSGITSGTQTINGLTDGTTYQIQVFFNDQRQGLSSRVMTYGDGEASASNVNLTAGGTGWGQFAIGTFTASGTTQSLTHMSNGFGNVHFNAILVTYAGAAPTPNAPANLTLNEGNNRNTLNWDDNTQPGFREFYIKRSTVSGGSYTHIGTTAFSVFSDTTAVNGTTYYYVVTTVNNDGVESVASSEVSGTPSASSGEPPNFLFIIVDDQATYSVNAYRNIEPVEQGADGNPYAIDTPNIDRLAAEGMLFHQARIMGSDSGAVCLPSRTCVMTGKTSWQRTAGVSAATTLPGIFNRGVRSSGVDIPYATYRTCKNGNSYPTANGEFTIVNDATKRGNTNGNGSEWHGDHGVNYIDHWQSNHRPNGKPFLIYLGFSHPHDTRNARTSPNLTGRYGCINTSNPAGITLNAGAPPLPINFLSCTPATFPAHPFDNSHLNVRDEVSVSGVDQYRTEAVIRNEIGRDFACSDWIDQQIGRVLARLEDPDGDGDTSDSVLDNTYIVYTSDHGMAIGRHGLQGKQNLYEHTWRVPYIVRGPGIAPGSRTNAMIYLHDTFPTFCDLAGIDVPATIDGNDGQSFRSVLEGSASTHRNYLYGLYAGGAKPGMRSVTDGRFKIIKYDTGSNATQVTQMFDLETNPFELLPEHGVDNIANNPAYAGIRARLEEQMMRERNDNVDPYKFLGDRSLFRFEEGPASNPAATLQDRLPWDNDGTAMSGNAGALPAFSADVPHATDFVMGEANTLSLDFEQDNQNYVQVADSRELDFGNAPFTIEAWVKLESMPTGANFASAMPVVMKKVLGNGDGDLDYMFLAAAGNYGNASNYGNLALHLGSTVIVSSLAIPDTGWHRISVALNPVTDTVRFTLDDQVDSQTTSAFGTTNNGPMIIGAHFNSSGVIDSAFDGLIDELSIVDGFLPVSELQPLMAVASVQEFAITGTQLSPDGSTFSLTFESNETVLYTVQKSSTLQPGSWEDVRTFVPGASGVNETTVNAMEVDPNEPREFYRVIVAQP